MRTKINPKYISGLSKNDVKLQKKYLRKSQREHKRGIYRVRPTPKSYKHRSSRHVVDFERIYGITTKNTKKIYSKIGVSPSKQKKILSKGKGAYYSAGSRPGQTPFSWAHARLASSLLGRRACSIDKNILLPVTCKKLRNLAKSHNSKTTSIQFSPGSTATSFATPHRNS